MYALVRRGCVISIYTRKGMATNHRDYTPSFQPISIHTRKGTATNAFFYVFNGLFYLNTHPPGDGNNTSRKF